MLAAPVEAPAWCASPDLGRAGQQACLHAAAAQSGVDRDWQVYSAAA
jgi:hypothetical protein